MRKSGAPFLQARAQRFQIDWRRAEQTDDAFFTDAAAQATFVEEAALLVAGRGLDGADLDVEQISGSSFDGYAATAGALSARLRAANPDASELTDKETGSRWDAYGKCLSGSLKGSQLESLILEPEYWFAWSEFHPETKIYSAPAAKH